MVRFTTKTDEANLFVSDGHAYADELMAMVILEKAEKKDIVVCRMGYEEGMFAYDMGIKLVSLSKYDLKPRFRSNRIEFSVCGIIWDEFGRNIFGKNKRAEDMWQYVDEHIIQEIDRFSTLHNIGRRDMVGIPCDGKSLAERVFNLNHKYPYDERINAYKEGVEICESELESSIQKAIKLFSKS